MTTPMDGDDYTYDLRTVDAKADARVAILERRIRIMAIVNVAAWLLLVTLLAVSRRGAR